ncbi:hypothetical protein AWC38_SpisGene10317 [Stylophora pistillata]|uniref:Uncharacterized protein n=1 Tax=Stylophora pistillata TaxID=50429 RepID=A0A2B4S8Z6_STYPI|nr:hypothetical protein AWC38_SpisGene10317 [Stylophora pistillata]
MDELLDIMEFHSDDDSLIRVIRDADQYLIDFVPDENDYDRRTWELRTMPSSIHTRPWSAACQVVCMLYDLRVDATTGDLDHNLNTMKDLTGIREAPTLEIKQAQTEVFDAFTNYLRVIKESAKPLGVTKDLEEYPAHACVVLDEVISCVDERAKMTYLEKNRTRITHSVLDTPADASDDEKRFREVYNGVMLAFDEFVRYCEDKPLPRDSFDRRQI